MANVDCRISRALQSYTITYPSPDETLLGTPVALPTSEPADPQISYTIAVGHLPTVSPAGLEYTLTAILYAAGKNTDAASQTVYYRILRNGASVATGSASVAANYYYTWNHYSFYNVVSGDVLACKLWASSANVNWDYKALRVHVTRIGPQAVPLSDFTLTSAAAPALALGTPFQFLYSGWIFHTEQMLYRNFSASAYPIPLLLLRKIWPIIVERGDNSLGSACVTNPTYRPYNYNNYVPTAISFRPLTIRV